MLMWSTLRSRADLNYVAIGTACLLVGSAFLMFGSRTRHMHGRWPWSPVWWLESRSCCSGVAALLGGVALLYRPELPRRLVAIWYCYVNGITPPSTRAVSRSPKIPMVGCSPDPTGNLVIGGSATTA